MGDIGRFFDRSEFACRCGCGFDPVDAVLWGWLTRVRSYFGLPVVITGPNRCEAHNAAEGGEKGSYHTRGRAADFRVVNVDAREVWEYLDRVLDGKGGLILYPGRVHLDSRSVGYREDKTTQKGAGK